MGHVERLAGNIDRGLGVRGPPDRRAALPMAVAWTSRAASRRAAPRRVARGRLTVPAPVGGQITWIDPVTEMRMDDSDSRRDGLPPGF